MVTDTPNLTVRGVVDAAGNRPVLDGQGQHANGISATGNNLVIENLTLRNYRNNGVFVDGATGIVLRDLFVEATGVYGVYPVHCSDVLIERVTATGVNDAGIYVGQCRRDLLGQHRQPVERQVALALSECMSCSGRKLLHGGKRPVPLS